MMNQEIEGINFHPQLPIQNSNPHQNILAQKPFFDLGRVQLSTYPLHIYADFQAGRVKLSIPAIKTDDIIHIWQGNDENAEVFDIEVSQSYPFVQEATLTTWDYSAYLNYDFEGNNTRDEVIVRVYKDVGGNPILLSAFCIEREDIYQTNSPQQQDPAAIIQDKFSPIDANYTNHFMVDESMNLLELEQNNNEKKYELSYLDRDNVVLESLQCELDQDYLIIEIHEHINKKMGDQVWRNVEFSISKQLYLTQKRVKIKRRNNQHQRTTKKKYTGHKINHSKQNMS
jgi:hypothetical protein